MVSCKGIEMKMLLNPTVDLGCTGVLLCVAGQAFQPYQCTKATVYCVTWQYLEGNVQVGLQCGTVVVRAGLQEDQHTCYASLAVLTWDQGMVCSRC